MKVIDLLNKIANGEEAPRKIKYCKHIYELIENKLDWYCYKNSNYFLRDEIGLWHLNFEVKIVDKDYIENIPEEDTPKEDTTINIQDLFNERVEQNKRIEELANINEKLSLALESAENKLNLISQYIRSLPTFHIGYRKDEEDIEKTMYASEFNFVDEIISLLENGDK